MKLCILLILCSYVLFLKNSNCILLHTKQGSLDGAVLISRGGRPFNAFFHIPYAKPPIGDLRFKNPVPAKSWSGVRDAANLSPMCLNIRNGVMFGQEDCLYLNVYTPVTAENNISSLPVMVYTYGGRFQYGSALPERMGPNYFMDKDVILITYHYRLGVLGFLSTEDEVIPGNFGLKDQITVLQWVQNYIEEFGGDKNRVTLFGSSSGGTSVGLVLVSPLAKGLIHRVISQSGPPLDLEKPGKARLNAWKFASFVGCNKESVKTSQDLLKCLRNIPGEELASKNDHLYTLGQLLPALPWGPVIENEKVPGAFLVDEPRKLLNWEIDIPLMTGINSNDGGMMAILTYQEKPSLLLQELDENYKTHFPLIFRYGYHFNHSTEQLNDMTEKIKRHYFGEKNISESIDAFGNMFTSLLYVTGIKETIELYKGPKYVYYYDHMNQQSLARMYSNYSMEKLGVIHGDELISMFNWSSFITPVTEGVDFLVSKQIIELWTNFVAKGDPNNDGESLWEPVKSPAINYLYIKDGRLEHKNEFLKSEIDFLYNLSVTHYF